MIAESCLAVSGNQTRLKLAREGLKVKGKFFLAVLFTCMKINPCIKFHLFLHVNVLACIQSLLAVLLL